MCPRRETQGILEYSTKKRCGLCCAATPSWVPGYIALAQVELGGITRFCEGCFGNKTGSNSPDGRARGFLLSVLGEGGVRCGWRGAVLNRLRGGTGPRGPCGRACVAFLPR
jgi:hypothetical protein